MITQSITKKKQFQQEPEHGGNTADDASLSMAYAVPVLVVQVWMDGWIDLGWRGSESDSQLKSEKDGMRSVSRFVLTTCHHDAKERQFGRLHIQNKTEGGSQK